jgi:hypothetical protein
LPWLQWLVEQMLLWLQSNTEISWYRCSWSKMMAVSQVDERALVLDSQISNNWENEEVSSISSWDQFKSVQRNPRQNQTKKAHCTSIMSYEKRASIINHGLLFLSWYCQFYVRW